MDTKQLRTQMNHLLTHLQNTGTTTIAALRSKPISGIEGKHFLLGNVWEVVRQLRLDGWVIEMSRKRPSSYTFKGHYSEYEATARESFIKAKAVYPPPHLARTIHHLRN